MKELLGKMCSVLLVLILTLNAAYAYEGTRREQALREYLRTLRAKSYTKSFVQVITEYNKHIGRPQHFVRSLKNKSDRGILKRLFKEHQIQTLPKLALSKNNTVASVKMGKFHFKMSAFDFYKRQMWINNSSYQVNNDLSFKDLVDSLTSFIHRLQAKKITYIEQIFNELNLLADAHAALFMGYLIVFTVAVAVIGIGGSWAANSAQKRGELTINLVKAMEIATKTMNDKAELCSDTTPISFLIGDEVAEFYSFSEDPLFSEDCKDVDVADCTQLHQCIFQTNEIDVAAILKRKKTISVYNLEIVDVVKNFCASHAKLLKCLKDKTAEFGESRHIYAPIIKRSVPTKVEGTSIIDR